MKKLIFTALAGLIGAGFTTAVFASMPPPDSDFDTVVMSWNWNNHPNGNRNPPPYGIRLDKLWNSGKWTFSTDPNPSLFDPGNDFPGANDPNIGLMMNLLTDGNNNYQIHIMGTVFGGKENGDTYVAGKGGLWQHEFRYREGVSVVGDLIKVTGSSLNNNGWIMPLFDLVHTDVVESDPYTDQGSIKIRLTDKANGANMSFIFDKDDHRLNCPANAECGDWVGRGWLKHSFKYKGEDFNDFYSFNRITADYLITAEKKPADSMPLGLLFGAGLVVLGLSQRKIFNYS